MNRIAKVVMPIALDREFDYSCARGGTVKKGMRVLVDFNGQRKVGLVTGLSAKSRIKRLKPVLDIFDTRPIFSPEQLSFAKKLSAVYPYPEGEFLFMMLPPYLRKARKFTPDDIGPAAAYPGSGARIFVQADSFRQRYRVWKEIVADKLKEGSVLVFFPQLSYLFKAREALEADFPGKICPLHSREKEKEFFLNWQRSRKKSLILGTRSAVFYYPRDTRLIVVEEENSPHYFQEEKPFYGLVEVAGLLSRTRKIDLILSAHSPSLETYRRIKTKQVKLHAVGMNRREVEVVRLGESGRKKIVNPVLNELLRKMIQAGKKGVVLWQRKGFARITSCSGCGQVLKCRRCSALLQSSLRKKEVICPYCGQKAPLPRICGQCSSGYFQSRGYGVERVEELLKRIFPEAKIDTWPNRGLDSQIIISTSQILSHLYSAETFDQGFLLDVDSFLSRPDYAATFKVFLYVKELLSFFRDRLYLFTRHGDYYLFKYLNQKWEDFYEAELNIRKRLKLPPFGLVAKIVLRAKDENRLLSRATALGHKLKVRFSAVYGPLKEQPFKLRDKFYYALIVKTKRALLSRQAIKEELKGFRSDSIKIAVSLR